MLNIAMGLSPASAADLQRKSGTTLWLLGDVDRALDAMALAHANAELPAFRDSRCESPSLWSIGFAALIVTIKPTPTGSD